MRKSSVLLILSPVGNQRAARYDTNASLHRAANQYSFCIRAYYSDRTKKFYPGYATN